MENLSVIKRGSHGMAIAWQHPNGSIYYTHRRPKSYRGLRGGMRYVAKTDTNEYEALTLNNAVAWLDAQSIEK